MFTFLKARRRAKLRARPFPAQWEAILSSIPACRRLPADLRAQLHAHTQVLLAEKRFEGCNGLEITDEVRVTIAGQAALLILNRETDYYPDLVTILVYPSVFYADVVEPSDDRGQIVSEYSEDHSGESWDVGVVILSWEDIAAYTSTGRGGYNVVLHEFAHQLDMENGAMDGTPRLRDDARRDAWRHAFTEAYQTLERATAAKRRTLLDPYGAEDPAEFFAVVTESFFERPLALRREYPQLYGELCAYYCVDPASWPPSGQDGTVARKRRPARSRRRN